MAVGLLDAKIEPHNWTHDYESIFWLLLWICAGSPVFHRGQIVSEEQNKEVLEIFRECDRLKCYLLKKHFLYETYPLEVSTITHPYFHPLVPCITGLRQLLFNHRLPPFDPERAVLTRESFRQVLLDSMTQLQTEPFSKEHHGTLIGHSDGRYHPAVSGVDGYDVFSAGTSAQVSQLDVPGSYSTSSSSRAKRRSDTETLQRLKRAKT